jgi:DNA-binding Lrp family transcriptional regulator
MNQTVDNAIGGYDDTENKLYQRYLVPMPTEELSRRADLSQPTLLKRVELRTSDSTSELCGGYIEAQNIAASRITPEEIRMLLEPSMYPRPKAERRVYYIKNKGKDKPINHADRRKQCK